jgi:benzoylformate decarboxylase
VDAGELNMAYTHPLYQGQTGHMFGFGSLPITWRGDAVLVCGTAVLPEVFPELGPVFAPDAKVVHIDLNVYEIAKNHPVSLGMLGDPKLSLAALAAALEQTLSPGQRQAAAGRREALARAGAAKRAAELAADRKVRDAVPMRSGRFMEELAARLPEHAIIFDEALTSSPALTRHMPPSQPGYFFQNRGGSLGVGFPGAIGVKLANPGKPVIAFSGDGGSMYTIQALWTAARHGIDVKFVVCNNASYQYLQWNITQYWKETGVAPHPYPLSFDLSYPALRFDAMARSMGVSSVRVEQPAEIAGAIAAMLSHDGPFLIDLVLEGDVRPDLIRPTTTGG